MTLRVSLPAEVADGLVDDGVADRVPVRRGAAPAAIDIVVTAAQTGAAVVAVAEGVSALNSLIKHLKRWRQRRANAGQGGDGDKTVVTITNAAGQDKTFVLEDVDENELARAILAVETT